MCVCVCYFTLQRPVQQRGRPESLLDAFFLGEPLTAPSLSAIVERCVASLVCLSLNLHVCVCVCARARLRVCVCL